MSKSVSSSVVLLCILSVIGGQNLPTPPPVKVASLNKYMDVILANFASSTESKQMNPLRLPNASFPITSKWYFPYEHLTLTDGLLHNLQSIKRHGDCWIKYANGTMEIDVDVSLDDLYVEYDFIANSSYSWFSLMGLLHGAVGKTQVRADITVDVNTMAIQAKQISFPGTKKLDFSIKSTILATWVVNVILEVVTLAAGLLMNDIEAAVTDTFNQFFDNYFPRLSP